MTQNSSLAGGTPSPAGRIVTGVLMVVVGVFFVFLVTPGLVATGFLLSEGLIFVVGASIVLIGGILLIIFGIRRLSRRS